MRVRVWSAKRASTMRSPKVSSNGLRRSHLDRHLAILAEIRLLSGHPCLGEFESRNERTRRSVPQFRRERFKLQQADIRIIRTARPPDLVGLAPGRLCPVGIARDAGAAGDRQVGVVVRIDKDKPDVGPGLDLILLGAADVGHEKNQASITVGSCLDRPRTQSTGEARGQHADANLFDNVPDPTEIVVLDRPSRVAEIAHGRRLQCSKHADSNLGSRPGSTNLTKVCACCPRPSLPPPVWLKNPGFAPSYLPGRAVDALPEGGSISFISSASSHYFVNLNPRNCWPLNRS